MKKLLLGLCLATVALGQDIKTGSEPFVGSTLTIHKITDTWDIIYSPGTSIPFQGRGIIHGIWVNADQSQDQYVTLQYLPLTPPPGQGMGLAMPGEIVGRFQFNRRTAEDLRPKFVRLDYYFDVDEDEVLVISMGADITVNVLWRNLGTECGNADINNDGFVNSFDLALLLGAWGPCDVE